MARADGGEQVPGGGQQMPQDEFDPFPHDGGQQEPGGSQLAVPDGPQVPGKSQQMPEHLTIGTQKAFENNYAFRYERKHIGTETIYVCDKGSDWSRTGEVLALRRESNMWTAFDSSVSADGTTVQCRQPVFRCLATDITQPGWRKWETNYAANPNDTGLSVDWQGELWAETRVP